MKLWNNYGSEHSMNLVMIGRFITVDDALKAKVIIEALTALASEEGDLMEQQQRFSDASLGVLRQLNFWTLAPQEINQFIMGATVEHDGVQITVTTEEADVSAYLKVLVESGARVEVYSAHDYPNTGYGRHTSSD